MSKKKIIPDLPPHWRDRMLARLRERYSDDVLKAYADDRAILLPNETLSEWPMHKVPENKDGMEALSKDVTAFIAAGQLSRVPSAFEEVDTVVEEKVDLQSTRRQRPLATVKIDLDLVPPHSVQAELGVLSCQMFDPQRCVPTVIEKLKGDPERFYDLRHQLIQKTIFELFAAQKPVDVISVQQWLKDKQLLEQAGGISYLAPLPDIVPSTSNLDYYLDLLCEKYVIRSLVNTCTDAVAKVYKFSGSVEELVDTVERDVFKVTGLLRENKPKADAKTLVKKTLDVIEANFANKGAITGLSTGFVDLDYLTTGLHPGELWIIAGYQSIGKTSLAMNIAEHVALNVGEPVGIFSYEMSAESLMLRFVCSRGRVNLRDVRGGNLVEQDFTKLSSAASKLAYSKLHIDDVTDANILELRAKGRRMVQEHGIKLFVVDYLQKIPGVTHRKNDTKEQEVASVSSGLKAMAMELKVPVLAIGAVNDDGRMRDSRMIGYDGDFVGLLEPQDEKAANDPVVGMWLQIKKQRNGPTDSVALTFLKQYTRFESAARVAEDV